jgi:hypothetical protein
MAQPGLLPLDPDLLPTLNPAAPEQPAHGPITSGVVRGVLDVLGGSTGAAVAGVGKLFGSPGIENVGRGIQDYTAAAAPSYNRPDLEQLPFTQGGPGVVPWLEYQAAKQAPLMAAYILGGRGLARAGVEAPEALQSVAARVPKVLGGGGLRAGMDEAAQAAAREAGKNFAQTALGAEVVGTPLAFGQMYQEAQNQPNGATHADAVRAAVMSPFYAALDAVEPAEIAGLFKQGLKGGIAKRAITAGLVGSASEVVQEGVQTAMEQSFRPDLTTQQKLSNIVTAAVTGGAVGGVFGGGAAALGGQPHEQTLRAVKEVPAADLQTDDIKGIVDQVLGLPAPGQTSGGVGPNDVVQVSPTGEARATTANDSYLASQQPDDTSRPFRNSTLEELQSAQNALLNKPQLSDEHANILDLVDQELQLRNGFARVDNVNQPAVETVEPNLTSIGGAASNTGAPVSTNTDIADLLKGITTRRAYAGAKTLDDVVAIARERYNRKAVAQGDLALVDRLKQAGVDLDAAAPVEASQSRVQAETGASTPVADISTTTTAPAAPANEGGGDPAFAAKWQAALKGLPGAAVNALRETNPGNAREGLTAVYKALGGEGPQEQGTRDGLETLGQRLGILDDKLQLTPLGQKVGRATIPTEEAVQGAIENGFSGQAAAFERGARASSVDKVPASMTPEQAKAYMAGHEWAIPKIAAPEFTEGATGKLRGTPTTLATTVNVSGEQSRQQVLNKVVDSLGVSASLKPSEIAQLKQMVRDGAPSREVIDAVQQVREGKPLFQQPAAKPSEPFKGVEVLPSTAMAQARMNREAAQTARAEQALRSGAQKREATSLAQKHLLLKNEVRGAFQSGDITQRDFIDLTSKLQQGKYDDVVAGLPGHAKERVGEATASGVTAADAKSTIGAITGKWRSGTSTIVYDNIDNVPDAIRARLSSDTVKGVYDPAADTMHIIAGNHSSPEDVKATVYHELLGHRGLQAAFGERLDALLGNIYRTNAGMRAVADEYLDATGKWADRPVAERQRNAVEEILAEGSEQGVVSATVWEKLTHLVREFGRKLGFNLAYTGAEVQAILAQAHAAIISGQEIGKQQDVSSPVALSERVGETVRSAIGAAESTVNTDGVRGKVRRFALGWAGEKAIEEHYAPQFTIPEGNGVVERRAAMNSKHAMSSRMSQPVTEAKDTVDRLKRTNPKAHEAINQLMQLSQYGLNPLRGWDKQSEEVRTAKNAANLKSILRDAASKVRSLSSTNNLQVYHDLRALNDIAILAPKATGLHLDVTADKISGNLIPAFKTAPMDEFMAKAASEEMDIQGTRNFWRQAIIDRINALNTFLSAQKQKADSMKGRERSELTDHIARLETGAQDLGALLKRLEDVPYFHLGRDGEYFVDMKLRTLTDGSVDPKALAAAAEHLAEFGRVISSESNQDHIYIRVKDEVAQRNLLEAAERLQKMRVVRRDAKDASTGKVEHAIQSGKRDDSRLRSSFGPRWLNSYIQRIEGDDTLNAADKKRLIDTARTAALDIMPDNSLSKVMTQRNAVPGFDPNMFDSFFDRQKIGIDAHVGMAVAPKITEAFGKMRLAVDRAQGSSLDKTDINTRNGMTEVVDELSRRDAQRPMVERTPVIDAVRQATNTWALGLSPAFVAMQVVQIPQLVYPRLGAKYGFVKAAKAMSGSTSQALAIMRQVFKDGYDISAARSFDAVISLGALQRAGVGKSTAEYLMHLANTGQLDIGGPNRELTRAVDGSEESPLNKVQRLASAPGYYAETFSRVLTALAHYKLNSELSPYDAAQAAAPFIEDTLWNYAQDMQGRMFGKRGVFGAYTPLATQFMTYTSQLVQRLYLDMHTAIAGDDPKLRSEARKFLLAHVAATTVFAGSLGLPFATLFAAAFDKLKDLGDDDGQPSNIQAAYRSWLTDLFGHDIEEVIAKGAPRAIGVDISQRVGEQDIFPFSKFISDRRALKDRVKDLAVRSWGAPASFASQALQGGEAIMDGNVIDGMAQLLPVGLGSLVKSYRMTEKGYVDGNGKQLPISTPSTNAILTQALGFAPADLAYYRERKRDAGVRKDQLTRQASNLRSQLADALISGDQDNARDLFGQVQKFDSANPAFAVMPSVEGSIRQRMRAQARAQALGLPLGVDIKDIAGQQAIRY